MTVIFSYCDRQIQGCLQVRKLWNISRIIIKNSKTFNISEVDCNLGKLIFHAISLSPSLSLSLRSEFIFESIFEILFESSYHYHFFKACSFAVSDLHSEVFRFESHWEKKKFLLLLKKFNKFESKWIHTKIYRLKWTNLFANFI